MVIGSEFDISDILDIAVLIACCCAVETGLFISLVLSTFPNPTIDFEIPDTFPVNVGSFIGAFDDNEFVILVA